MKRYISRFKKYSGLEHKLFVISESRKSYAEKELNNYTLKLPIEFISWQKIQKMIKISRKNSKHIQRAFLDELNVYFKKVSSMQDKKLNEVFCVVISDEKLVGDFTFLNVIKKGFYFYPIRNNWPKNPPTYMVFRHKGKLLSIHYVEGYKMTEKPWEQIPILENWKGWAKEDIGRESINLYITNNSPVMLVADKKEKYNKEKKK